MRFHLIMIATTTHTSRTSHILHNSYIQHPSPGVVLHETSVLPDHAQEETLHIKVMETELRRLKAEVSTLLNDLKRTEGMTEELVDRCRAAEETKDHIAGMVCAVLCVVNLLLCSDIFLSMIALNKLAIFVHIKICSWVFI